MKPAIQPLNEVQRSLLAIFSRGMTETEQNDIKEILLNYYDTLLQQEVEKVIIEKGYQKMDFERILNDSEKTSK